MKNLKIPKISGYFDIIIISLIAFYPELYKFIWYVFFRLGLKTISGNLHIIVWSVLLLCFYKQFTQRLPKIYYGIYIAVSVVLSVFCIFPWYYAFSWTRYFDFILKILPYFMLGRIYRYDEKQKDVLYALSAITFFLSFFYIYFFTMADGEFGEDNMYTAYNVLPSVLIFCTSFFEKKKIFYKIMAILGIAYLFLLGTRGPVLWVAIFIVLMVIKHFNTMKSIVLSCVIVTLLSVYMSSSAYENFFVDFSKNAKKAGFSTRIFDFVEADDITNDTGRGKISARVIEEIKENPFEIRGPYSDWIIIGKNYSVIQKQAGEKGVYVHNLFLELLTHYGVIFGSIIALFVLASIFRLYNKVDKHKTFIACMLICIGFVILMVSSSYMLRQSFFFLLGLCYNKEFLTSDTKENEDEEEYLLSD